MVFIIRKNGIYDKKEGKFIIRRRRIYDKKERDL